MLILAFESSAKPASVAVYDSSDSSDSLYAIKNGVDSCGKLLGQYFQNNGFSHSRTLLAMAESLLINLGIKLSEIGLIAVASGPGSFTGVRIGVSAVKGLAFGSDIPVCGVSTLEAMAWQTPAADTEMIICPVMDARREQVYNALFKWDDTVLERLCDDRAISIEELAVDLLNHELPCLLVGDGVKVCSAGFAGMGSAGSLDYSVAPEPMRYQTAYGVALAALKKEPAEASKLEPFYLRPSQAEREREE